MFELHAVLVDKSVPFARAQEIAGDIIGRVKPWYRETTNQYRFRAVPKTKFGTGSFYSKTVHVKDTAGGKHDIVLVFGKRVR